MFAFWKSTRLTTAVLLSLSLLAILLIMLAPVERSLGSGIRIVYLHVSLTWVGMAGLLLAGAVGLALLIWPHVRLQQWLRVLSYVAFGFYVVGAVVSLIAEEVNWGAIFWHEPRTASVLQVVAVGVIVHVASSWLPQAARVQGLLHLALASFMVWATARAELVLHPENPVGLSSSGGIRLGFYGLTALFGVAATWLVLHLKTREIEGEE